MNTPWHRWNNGGRRSSPAQPPRQAPVCGWLLRFPVREQCTAAVQPNTQSCGQISTFHFRKVSPDFLALWGFVSCGRCFQTPNTLTAFCKGLTVNTQWVLADFIVTRLQMMWKRKQVKINCKHAISVKNPFLIVWTHFLGSMPKYCFEFTSISTTVGLQIWKRCQSLLQAKECGNKYKLLFKASILYLVSVSVTGCMGYSGYF